MCSWKIQCGLLFWDMNLKWLTEMHVDLFDFDENLKGEVCYFLHTESLMSIKETANGTQDVAKELQ